MPAVKQGHVFEVDANYWMASGAIANGKKIDDVLKITPQKKNRTQSPPEWPDYNPATKIAHEKWPICLLSPGSAEIASENTGYLPRIPFKSAFQAK
ncbi:hypothetical protein [Paenibacillus cymbidii]|uniref:hypothetical protein n=1 Tax=Paenibacillus cymbidii TaxID=1639034 RepID=UPI00108131BC|nr:hypothetical protein [Paenibacillus cymbidii]